MNMPNTLLYWAYSFDIYMHGNIFQQIFTCTSQKCPEIPGQRTKSNFDFWKTTPHRSPCPLILKIWCLLGNSQCLLSLVLWLITLWRVWNPRGSEAREILQKGHFYFLLSLTHSFSTKLCILVSKAWTTVPFVFVLSTVLCVPTFMYVKSYCMHKMHSLIY